MKLIRSTFLIVGLLVTVGSALAADILWQTPTTISGDSDVNTVGILDRAYNVGSMAESWWSEVPTTTVSGVTFTAFPVHASQLGSPIYSATIGSTTVSSPLDLRSWDGFGSGASPFASLSLSYKNLLSYCVYVEGTPLTLTLNGLNPGHTYLFQSWVNDSRTGATRTESLTGGSATSGPLDYNTSDTNGGRGQFVIGTFVANATSQVITYNALTPGWGGLAAQLQAFQLRHIPRTWDANTGTTGPQDGNGNWTTGNNWWTTSQQTWADNDDAVFGVGGSGNITLNTAVTARSLTFNSGFYTISGTGSITLSGGTITVNGVVGRIMTEIAGTAGITKTGVDDPDDGILYLDGNNTYSGANTVLHGQLVARSNTALGSGGSVNIVADGAFLQLEHATGITISGEDVSIIGTGAGVNGRGAFGSWSGNNIWNGSVTLTGDSTIYAQANTLTINGPISGAFNLTKGTVNNNGTIVLAGANTFSGDTRVRAGRLVLNNAQALYNSTLDMNAADAGTVTFPVATTLGGLKGSRNLNYGGIALSVGNNGQNTTYSGALTGSGTLTKLGTGTLTLSGANTFSGGTRVTAGTLVLNNAQALYNSTLDMNAADAGTVTFPVATTLGGLKGSRNLDYGGIALSIGNNGQYTTYSGALTGTGTLTKLGTGILYLDGANTHSGANMVNKGYVVARNNAALGSGGSINIVASGATLQLEHPTGITISGEDVSIIGTGPAVGEPEGDNRGAFGSWSGNNIWNGSVTLTGDSTIYAQANTFTINGPISGAFNLTKGTVKNNGTIVLAGANTFSGDTRVRAGRLVLNNAQALYNSTLDMNAADAGTVTFTVATTLGGLKGSRNLNYGGIALAIGKNGRNTTYSGALTGSGTLTKIGAGTLILTANNSYTGPTTINGGTLSLVNGTSHNIIPNSPTITISANATLDGTGLQDGKLVLNPGQIIKGSGTVLADTEVGNSAKVSPGSSPGTQTYVGTQYWTAGGTYLWEINDALGTAGSDPGWDLINVNGTLDLTGLVSPGQFTIDIEGLSLANFNSHASYAFPILNATLINGFDSNTFAFATGGSLAGTASYASWSIQSIGNQLWLNYTAAVPEPTVVGLLSLGGLLLFIGRKLRRNQSH